MRRRVLCSDVMRSDADFDDLWRDTDGDPAREPVDRGALPEVARRYFDHALPPGAEADRAVRLEMRGELRLGKRWRPFTARQVTHASRGFVWQASARTGLLRVAGSDRCVDGVGRSRWSLFGVLPIVNATGPDITRSSAERAASEWIFLPAALLAKGRGWEGLDAERFAVTVAVAGHDVRLELGCDERGALRELALDRWGTPDGPRAGFRLERFGCRVLAEDEFDGRRIPSRLRAGWGFGDPHREAQGEFFRAEVVSAAYR